jgi:hypothetical protein
MNTSASNGQMKEDKCCPSNVSVGVDEVAMKSAIKCLTSGMVKTWIGPSQLNARERIALMDGLATRFVDNFCIINNSNEKRGEKEHFYCYILDEVSKASQGVLRGVCSSKKNAAHKWFWLADMKSLGIMDKPISTVF